MLTKTQNCVVITLKREALCIKAKRNRITTMKDSNKLSRGIMVRNSHYSNESTYITIFCIILILRKILINY